MGSMTRTSLARTPLARSLRGSSKRVVNRQLAKVGIEIRRRGVQEFLPLQRTVKAAEDAGLSLSDYIDEVINHTPGATQSTVDAMREAGVFTSNPRTILEIGPGSGRYLEKTLAECTPSRYEIYETAKAWADYLAEEYAVVVQPTDGTRLVATPDASVDLLHAHKVFSSITFLTTIRYFDEVARVVRPGGWAVFDVLTESALDPATVEAWATRGGYGHDSFPAAIPRAVVLETFSKSGFSLKGSYLAPLGVASTEVLMFQKQ